MNKIASHMIVSIMILLGTFTLLANTSATGIKGPGKVAKKESEVSADQKAKILLFRLHEIKTMDKSNLTAFDKKELRKEIRSIKRQFREIYRGSYISLGSVLMTELLLNF